MGCDHEWSDPSIGTPPITCNRCGAPKVVDVTVAFAVAEKLVESGSYDTSKTVRVDAMSLATLIVDNERLKKQVGELQRRGTEMALERQQRRELNKKAIMELLGQRRDSCNSCNPHAQAAAWAAYDDAISIVSRT